MASPVEVSTQDEPRDGLVWGVLQKSESKEWDIPQPSIAHETKNEFEVANLLVHLMSAKS